MIRSTSLAVCFAAFSSFALAQAQTAPSTWEPYAFQPGKDSVWIPTTQAVAETMLDVARVTPSDVVMDLGSGDGVVVISAAKRGARAVGIEYDADLVGFSRRNAEKEGVGGKASFIEADIFETDLSGASVITLFLPPKINLKLRPKLLALKPGTRIVSNTFDMGDWEADETVTLPPDAGCDAAWCTALLWIVPVRVAGTHALPQGELSLKQDYQRLSGTLRTDGKTFVLQGTVRGEEVSFNAGGRTYRGKMNGKVLELR